MAEWPSPVRKIPSISPWRIASAVISLRYAVRSSSGSQRKATSTRYLRGSVVSCTTEFQSPLLTSARMARAYGSVSSSAISAQVSSQSVSDSPFAAPAIAIASNLWACVGSLRRNAEYASFASSRKMAKAAPLVCCPSDGSVLTRSSSSSCVCTAPQSRRHKRRCSGYSVSQPCISGRLRCSRTISAIAAFTSAGGMSLVSSFRLSRLLPALVSSYYKSKRAVLPKSLFQTS